LTFGPSLLFLPTLSSRWVKSQNWTDGSSLLALLVLY
jgi:hypothetical protein